MDFGQVIAHNRQNIIDAWMRQVQKDIAIESEYGLTYEAVLNSLPQVIDTVSSLLSSPNIEKDIEDLIKEGFRHGEIRAVQGYEPTEIVREYTILRNVLLSFLEPTLLQSEPLLVLRAVRLIDGAVDRVAASCLKRYTDERLRTINRLYDEMLASNQELDRLLRTEQTNLAHLAHELKSPLSCIIGYSDLFLRQQDKRGELNLNFIERVLSSGRQLLEMINEALELSLYKEGKVPLMPEPIMLCDIVQATTDALYPIAQQKGLQVSLECEPEDAHVVTDRQRLQQVLTNIVSNAIRYTEEGSVKINVHLPEETGFGRSDDRIEIEIIDTGLGIEEAEQQRIFEPYYQGAAGQQQPTSTGLGLSIAHQLVQLLQGRIDLTSELNKGSTFVISLPLELKVDSTAQNE